MGKNRQSGNTFDSRRQRRRAAGAALLVPAVALLLVAAARAPEGSIPREMPWGSQGDINFAQDLWQRMEDERIVGDNAAALEPFFGGAAPHGMVLEITSRNLTVATHTGFLVVKKNYEGQDVSVESVTRDRSRYLASLTVMYQRETGYDSDNQNWFWVKYKPGGDLFVKDIGGRSLPLAGRIGKGKTPDENTGCIYCHRSAGGGNYIFYDMVAPPPK